MTEEKKKTKRKGRKTLVLLLITILALAGLGLALRVTPKTEYRTVEMGTPVSNAAENYLNGLPAAIKLAKVDSSQVNKQQPGTYTIMVNYLMWKYPFSVEIVDTTPPELTVKTGEIWIGIGREYSPDYFIQTVGDNSEQYEVRINDHDAFTSEMPGDQTVTITAIDPSGNQTEENVTVMGENPPEIIGGKNYYITPDAETDYKETVIAQDIEDGDLTKLLTIDDSSVNQSQDGTYSVTYEVTDSNGVSTQEEMQVTVCSSEELEQLVGNRSISVTENRVIGIPNFRDAGEGSFSTIEEESEYEEASLVYLKLKGGNMSGHGSGFILHMTQDYVDICSNEHVLQYPAEYYTAVFAGGGKASKVEILGTNEENDLGFARVKREDIPQDTWDQLLSVHLNQNTWDNLENDSRELFVTILDEQGNASELKKGQLLDWNGSAIPYHTPEVMEFNINVEHGDSGSPVFDAKGNLMSVAFGYIQYATGERRRFGIQLDEVIRLYEEMTGNQLYTY